MCAAHPPITLLAGSSSIKTTTLDEYLADQWTLTFVLSGPSNLDAVAAMTGVDHVETVTAPANSSLFDALYRWNEAVRAAADPVLQAFIIAELEVALMRIVRYEKDAVRLSRTRRSVR
jgi:hypothetical protein